MNIDKELENIIIEHNIDCHHKRFRERIKAVKLLNNLVSKYTKEDRILIIGSKLIDIKMFCSDTKTMAEIQEKVVDIDDKSTFADICTKKIDKVFIVSFEWHKEIAAELFLVNIEALSIYDYFIINGLELEHEYYAIFGNPQFTFSGEKSYDYADYNNYRTIFFDKRKYKTAKDLRLQQIYLEKLIFDCVYMKDFISAKKYIDEYTCKSFERIAEYQSFLINLEQLFLKIKENLNKKHSNIIMFWLDALEYDEDNDMPFLKGLSDKGLTFEQAFTVTPYTHFTAKTIFCKTKVVDDESYKMEDINKENSILIQYLEKKGYQFRYYGSSGQYADELKANHIFNKFASASSMYWAMMKDMLQDEKLFCMVHELVETHYPFMSTDLEGNQCILSENIGIDDESRAALRESQREPSRKYMDRQLEFYSEFLENQHARIYMSDHGHTLRGRFHTILKVVGEKIKPQKCNNMFSYINFYELVQYIIDKNQNLDNLFSNYVEVQDVDYYNPKMIEKCLNKERFNKMPFIGYRGVITEEDEFFRYNDGEEVYFSLMEDRPMEEKRINELREITGIYKINIEKEEKFKASRLVYKVLENYKKRTSKEDEKKKEILCNMFRDIPDWKKVAIRCGGENTRRLFWAIDWEQRKKISYIIDINLKCVSNKLGIPVILPQQIEKMDIDIIILSCFPSNNSIQQEISHLSKKYIIIDMYEYLKERGVTCDREFYNPVYIDEDFDVI